MCGICGGVNLDDVQEVVRRMCGAMRHRGPDSEGYCNYGEIALGVRRLRIIDIDNGDMPLFNEDRNVAVILNGEIYNYLSLHQELTNLGHRFTSRSDTETIVHAYEQWGTECLRHLRGMFALAILDWRGTSTGYVGRGGASLLLARDRLGIKPLYIWQDQTRFLFASEVRALLRTNAPRHQISAAGLYSYLAFGSLQEPLTLIENITSLPPASWLKIESQVDGVKTTEGRFWEPCYTLTPVYEANKVSDALVEALAIHMRSDVPIGAFLSGGLDSGAVVAFGSKASNGPMRTFTMAFDDWPQDERARASATARMWGTTHITKVISQQEMLADLPEALAAMDQPTSDGVNTWFVSREARKAGLTVALSGLGGDELFAGYPAFRQVPWLKRICSIMPRMPFAEELVAMTPWCSDRLRKIGSMIGREFIFDHPYFAVRGLFTKRQVEALIHPSLRKLLNPNGFDTTKWRSSVRAELERASHFDCIGEVSWLELTQYMRSTLLRDTDSMSMAHSLEIRVPFLDHLLVDTVLPIPGRQKNAGRQPKPMLGAILRGMVPQEVVTSPKRTFTFPFESWLRDQLADEIVGGLREGCVEFSECLSPKAVNFVWHDFEKARTNWARPWSLYVLFRWMSRHM